MVTTNELAHPIHELLEKRWSPRSFTKDQSISQQQIESLFEAARWAPSSYNAQPWEYIYALKSDEAAFRDLVGCLNDANARWAKDAGILILALAKTSFDGRDGTNGKAEYDLGQANFALVTQAMSLGLHAHQMGGFSPEKATEKFQLPDDRKPVVMIALGYKGPKEDLPDDLQKKEIRRKDRKVLNEFVLRHRGD